MKTYQTQVFQKNGINVNAVYVVKVGDTLYGIEKTVKRLGGQAKDIFKIEPELTAGLAPGQFVYFRSDWPRSPDMVERVLNNHELEKCPYQTVILKKGINFKKTLDEISGHKNGWIEILAVNRMSASDFSGSGQVQVKIFHGKVPLDRSLQVQKANADSDRELAQLQARQDSELVTSTVARTPTSVSDKPQAEANNGLMSVGLIIFVIVFLIAYRKSKKKIAFDEGD